MLSFSTDFPITESSSADFARCVRTWVEKMPLARFDSDQLDHIEAGQIDHVVAANQSLERLAFVGDDRESLGFRHSVSDGGVTYNTRVVYSCSKIDTWVGIRTERLSENPQIRFREAKKPQIIKAILSTLGGGLDGELYVSDKPHILADNDLNMAARLLNGDSENYLPIAYVSRAFAGGIALDYNALARNCAGLAHVMVEPSRDFSRALQQETSSGNAYGGAVGIFMPTGERSFLLPDRMTEQDLRFEVANTVRRALLARRPLHRCNWQDIVSDVSRQRIDELKRSGSQDLDAFVVQFDAENSALASRLEEAESENRNLRTKLAASMTKHDPAKVFNAKGSGQDYFPNETNEFIRDALKNQIDMVHDGSRRQQKIREVVASLGDTQEAVRRKEAVRVALNSASSFDDAQEELQSLGFSLKSEKNHYKIVYNDDDRYTFTLPKTASDHRAFRNMASDINKKIF